ncbi:hypothetical protein KDA_74680 [Dictyobacter alpinus]|uniref:Uncharacterized protein n=1 Tax=Dictyobacter alpinus TaxID=2014873 RepID=A0A402BKV4_9CHLR|nr:hypothetical protein [Dictyobacter alpinus]GCE31984.1 hypothetical protein KDA_74680 [Dictyobacter alpinus]
MDLEVILHPIGSWGLRRSDGKIMMKLVQTCIQPFQQELHVLVFDTYTEAACQHLNLLTTEQRQQQGIF